MRTVQQLQAIEPGFEHNDVVTFTADPQLSGYAPQQEKALISRLTARVREIPSVVNVAVAARGVMRGRGIAMTVARTGERPSSADFLNASVNVVSPHYFDTMGIQIVAGRDFNGADDPSTIPKMVIVNQAFVRRYFPNVDALGHRFGAAAPGRIAPPTFEIIGVVSDAKYRSLREPMTPTIFQVADGFGSFVLHVRTTGRPDAVIGLV